MAYNLRKIRALLTEGFDIDELRRFCYDHAGFRAVYHQLSPEMGKDKVIDRLLAHSEQTLQVEHLLAWAKAQNPRRYEEHGPYSIAAPIVEPSLPLQNKQASKPRIFLCHASEDKPRVMELYHRLKAASYHPWLDKYDLLPGQSWRREIEKIIRDPYSLVLVCLSSNSVTKRGVVQQEITWALDILDQMPEETIYLIPVRLEVCQVPNRLSELHWVNLFEADGFEYLKRALDYEIGKRQPAVEVAPAKPPQPKSAAPAIEETLNSPANVLRAARKTPIPQPQVVRDEDNATVLDNAIEVKHVVDWMVAEFKKEEGIDLSQDKQARQRLKDAAEKAKIELSTMRETEINLPFITADASGPKHLQLKLTRRKFEQLTEDLLNRVKQPFEPELILIPAGEFLMGSDPQVDNYAKDNERPQHRLFLPDYYMAKTPVTKAHYAAFVQATKHRLPKDWTSIAPPKGDDHHPVVYVSWKDAAAYCRWLAHVTGKPYRLPAEAEWEKAARGREGRIYPWGNERDATRSNTYEGGKGATTPVGSYLSGASLYGVLDMAGNVWEWCATKRDKPYPYNVAEDEWTDSYIKERADRALRGGAFNFSGGYARCAFRGRLDADGWYDCIGFRVVVSPI